MKNISTLTLKEINSSIGLMEELIDEIDKRIILLKMTFVGAIRSTLRERRIRISKKDFPLFCSIIGKELNKRKKSLQEQRENELTMELFIHDCTLSKEEREKRVNAQETIASDHACYLKNNK